jgi:hypothetical protein|tara:strand:- start:6453 stop:7073 length:621 start_codon:yes stop_codon:yes gene_type:complete
MNDSLYNFSDKSDSDNNNSIKMNMDDLFAKKQQQDLNVLNNYNKILGRIHNKIKFTSKQLVNEQCIWYIMPEMMIGIPKYNHKDCTVYAIGKLRDNGFIVRYTHPNLLFISWKHWIPNYVRNEIKKQTGKRIDETGNMLNENEEINPFLDDFSNGDNNFDNLMMNKSKSIKSKQEANNNYKDVKSYNPSGNLIYTNTQLKKLDIDG